MRPLNAAMHFFLCSATSFTLLACSPKSNDHEMLVADSVIEVESILRSDAEKRIFLVPVFAEGKSPWTAIGVVCDATGAPLNGRKIELIGMSVEDARSAYAVISAHNQRVIAKRNTSYNCRSKNAQ